MIKLRCSQCGKRFQGENKGDILTRLRRHQVKSHNGWLSRRVKNGMRKARQKKYMTGFAERGVIEKLTGQPYESVRDEVLRRLVTMIMGDILPKS